ncbi:crossover junction endodeoxyribonuclease RuvC [Dictyoglomus thermophilum]|uniref:Crossover junction endodeoxyribonuclease RuvC n=1 Tax=Dictyoglomus thermophilum (strain ATCC 35947 / DSM 3960 / H-6-12) TaxID=309799 RepID=RUVC_DICT6|nr:crossover junction endodeoxyribonuclease RuvC [Dictyoglomus thermophilum]B5YFL3.1 RecName: Full=Crossover junction endodeoxyribonuclease RuvC; AltName: Full=Holliday junction nuclease RuvC; AltName: Full=Holliday junction resolvase RuvC [Dictyoglomus thermophilum H-6-12]ACI18395.1 crossover junction endodeoxyribonuclease RuvC [Dictyoglomus thermophilum H-6-12]
MIVIGFDPGTAITGYGILNKEDDKIAVIEYGALTTPSNWSIGRRLNYLFDQVSSLLDLYNPDAVVMEEVFFNKNIKTAISIGQAQGVIILAAQQHQREVSILTPLEVKLSVVGYGRATKDQVQYMVKEVLKLKDIPKPDDVADALALCISYIYKQEGC